MKENENLRRELKCKIYPFNTLGNYKYVVICTYYQGEIVLCRHSMRDTWETQGGHIENGETPIQAAERELYEESGIIEADLYPVCDYYGYNSQSHSNGAIFLAVARRIGKLPSYEMKEISLFDVLPQNLTYPQATPKFFEEAYKLLKNLIVS